MKKLSLLFLLAICVLSACKKEIETVEKLFTFEMRNEKSFTAKKDEVNQAYNAGLTQPFPLDIASDSEAEFKKNNTSTNLVKNIKLQELKMEMPSTSAEDFSFLTEINAYIAYKDGSEPVLMATAKNIPANVGKTLILTPTENAMDKYVKTGNYSLIIDGKFVRPVVSDLNIRSSMIFSVTASPLD
jgi:hypothetical protein